MKDLSLHLLDVAKNSVAAGASHVAVTLEEDEAGWLTLTIADDGRGMSPEFLAQVTDPFTTTRTTRKVGLGLPLLRLTAEQTGGSLAIESALGAGTTVTARFQRRHLDCPPGRFGRDDGPAHPGQPGDGADLPPHHPEGGGGAVHRGAAGHFGR